MLVQFGTQITDAPPGSAHGLYLVVSDIGAGRDELMRRGANSVRYSIPGARRATRSRRDEWSGQWPDPDDKSYSSFATFEDPDGNGRLSKR